ncbi:conserved hypothetical protein [Hyphomicrobium sp. GJ21]|uniref:DUF6876 family protein n=1 Tax=Hyphomicrobium sp. GJ21 TaxID=113574 RepID=UPI0003F65DEE|nr:DUF6876 family protein [Hyphomicrobium sp. GJ21]CEJ88095.1 conserved hypothetical protein [Hyphomicrobium sp. GJ21]
MTTTSPAEGRIAPEALHDLLLNFTGTEHYYRHPLARRVVWTDGVKAFADAVGGYWLLDILATELPRFVKTHGIVFIHVSVKGGKAMLSAYETEGQPPSWQRPIDYTDCPEGGWRFYMAAGGPQDTTVILLPSEY